MSQLSTGTSDDERKKRKSPKKLEASSHPSALLSGEQVRQMLGGITNVTLSRRLRAGTFVKPDVVIGTINYWQLQTVLNHIESLKGKVVEVEPEHKRGRRYKAEDAR